MSVMTWPDVRIRCQGVTLSGPRNPGGPEMCKNGDFVKNPQNWPKMPNLSKMPKTVILAKTPKMTKKQRFFGSVQKCSARALTCGETRRIIYCLDTRYGPQNGGFGPPRGVGRFTPKYANPRNREFAHFGENRVFRVLQKHRKTEYPERGRPMESTGSRIDQRSE